jgi:hypothetical protein
MRLNKTFSKNHTYRLVRIPRGKFVLWAVERNVKGNWVVYPTDVRMTRSNARRMRRYLVEVYGLDPKELRIRAYVPDPFLNRDYRPSR